MSYVTEVADYFLSLNPEIIVLGPADYLIIAEWEKQEVPLSLVLNSILEFSTKKENNSGVPFDHVMQEVKTRFEIWLRNTPDVLSNAELN